MSLLLRSSSSSLSSSTTTSLSSIARIAALLLAIVVTVSDGAETLEMDDWIVPWDGPKESTAKVGDTITFDWDAEMYGVHNVYIHPMMNCSLDDAIYVGDTSPTSYTFAEDDGSTEGKPMYFACDISEGAHCQAGQWTIVNVFSGDIPPAPPTPPAPPAEDNVGKESDTATTTTASQPPLQEDSSSSSSASTYLMTLFSKYCTMVGITIMIMMTVQF